MQKIIMNKITKTSETNVLLQRQLTRAELCDLFILTYRRTTEILRLSTFFYRMWVVSDNKEYKIISTRIYNNHLKYCDLNSEFEQQLNMRKNPKIELVAHLIQLNSEIEQILNLIRNIDLNSYYLIFTDNENERDYSFEQMKIKFKTENQSKANPLKIVFRKTSC